MASASDESIFEENTFDESALLARLKTGEKKAFEELVRRYHLLLKHTAAGIIGEAQAEEVVQESWLSAMRALPDFEGRSSLKTWLFSIVINEARGRLRKGKREVSLDDQMPDSGLYDTQRYIEDGHWAKQPTLWHDNSPEALLSHEQFRECLDVTLANLPEAQRSVLTLREYQGMELEEICNILDVSASNIRVLLHRARARIYAMVEHFEETGEC